MVATMNGRGVSGEAQAEVGEEQRSIRGHSPKATTMKAKILPRRNSCAEMLET